jgi:copper chaperone CopZ
MKTGRLKLTGMHCEGCARYIKNRLMEIEGVSEVAVSLENETAEITFDEKFSTPEDIAEWVNKSGLYKASVHISNP